MDPATAAGGAPDDDATDRQYGGGISSSDDDVEALNRSSRSRNEYRNSRSSYDGDNDTVPLSGAPPLRDNQQRQSPRDGMYDFPRMLSASSSRQTSSRSDQVEIDVGGQKISLKTADLPPTPPSSTPPAATPAAVAQDSKLLELDDQGRRVSRAPSRSMRLKKAPTGSSPCAVAGMARISSTMVSKDQEAKLAAARAPTQGVSKVSSTTIRTQLKDLEDKKLTANPPSSSEARVEHRMSSRKLSVSELERGKKIAASGMRMDSGSLRGSLRESIRSNIARTESLASKERKSLQDQAGRKINLDAEFARLHSVIAAAGAGQQVTPPVVEEFDVDGNIIPALPGAIAVYGAQYEGDEDLEPDYVNPDNFDAAARLLAQREAASRPPAETPEVAPEIPHDDHLSYIHGARTESITNLRGGENSQGQKQLPNRKKCLWLSIIAIALVVAIGVAVGVGVGIRGGGGAKTTPSLTTYQASEAPTTLSSTASPSSIAPSQAVLPSSFPSSASSIAQWILQGQVEGESFGTTAELTSDLLAFSNGTVILSYELVGSVWTQVGQVLNGDIVRQSEIRRIAVRNEDIVRAYDLVDGIWTQAGFDIQGGTDSQSISISSDGWTIATSSLVSIVQHRSQIWRFDDGSGDWYQVGQDIIETATFFDPPGTALTSDGNKLAVAFENREGGFSLMFKAPADGQFRWDPLLSGQRIFGGGPAVAMSQDGAMLVTGGTGRINSFNTTTELRIGKVIELEGSRDTPLVALTDDGLRLAYAWRNNLRIVDFVNSGWKSKGVLPAVQFTIASLSFSSDGKLAVGQPEGNLIQILEILERQI